MYIKTISESKGSTWDSCKLKYQFRYVDRLPEPKGANTDALRFGSYVHEVLELGVKAKATTLEELTHIADGLKDTYNVSESYKGKDLRCFKNFLTFDKKLTETVGIELVYEVPLAEDILQNGIIDRVCKGTDGGLLIIDYKTSKREKSKVDLYQDSQLKGYVNAISTMYKVPVSKIVAAHYYPLTNNFVHVQYNNPQIHAWKRGIVEKVWRIRKAKKENMKPSRNEFCNWCAYKPICSEFNDIHTCQKGIEDLKVRKKLLAEAKKASKKS